MRKRVKKKKLKTARTVFRLRKKIAIAELVTDTYASLGRLLDKDIQPSIMRMMADRIYFNFLAQRNNIIHASEASIKKWPI